MWGLSTERRQQGGEGRWRQEGTSRAGEGGGAAVITKGLWVVAVDEGGVAGHGGGLAAQRLTTQCGRIDVRGELLGGRAEVRVWDEGTPHAVVAGQHVRPCRQQDEALRPQQSQDQPQAPLHGGVAAAVSSSVVHAPQMIERANWCLSINKW